MRLVHLTTTDISLELLLGPQLEAFRDAGYEVLAMSAPGPYVAAIERRGIRHVALTHTTRSAAPFEDVRALLELVAKFRLLRPAIVHTHNPKPGVYGRVAARIARVPVVVNTVHGLYAQPTDRFAKRALVYGLERLAAAFGDLNLVQNREDLATLRRLRVPDRELALLGNGIDLQRFSLDAIDDEGRAWARAELGAVTPDDVIVGLVGRLVREKGYLEVFEAARKLRACAPQIRFAVIGGTEDAKGDALTESELDRARAAGVRVLGARDDVERLYPGMDLHVLASHREGFPRSPMEAAAMGVPVIATDIRGCREVVEPGITGVLVPVRDPQSLAGAIERLARDHDTRRRLGAAGLAKARREFDQQRCIDITLDAYRRLLDERRVLSAAAVG